MINILLAVFAAAMLFASLRHMRAVLRRQRVLKDMYDALDVAAERSHHDDSSDREPVSVTTLSGEYPIVRGVLVETPPELRREKKATDANESGRHLAV